MVWLGNYKTILPESNLAKDTDIYIVMLIQDSSEKLYIASIEQLTLKHQKSRHSYYQMSKVIWRYDEGSILHKTFSSKLIYFIKAWIISSSSRISLNTSTLLATINIIYVYAKITSLKEFICPKSISCFSHYQITFLQCSIKSTIRPTPKLTLLYDRVRCPCICPLTSVGDIL